MGCVVASNHQKVKSLPDAEKKPCTQSVHQDISTTSGYEEQVQALEAEVEKLRRENKELRAQGGAGHTTPKMTGCSVPGTVKDSADESCSIPPEESYPESPPVVAQGGSLGSRPPSASNEPADAAVSTAQQISTLTKGTKLQWTVCLGEELGEGTSGKVCELEPNSVVDLGGKYAVKLVICKGAEKEQRLTEAKLHAFLGAHPSLVHHSYSWFDADAETLCVLMERCHQELWEYITEKPSDWIFTLVDKARWSVQLADGLHHIRMHNVIHRDLSPWNIFTKGDNCTSGQTNLKIGDFGLAVQIKSSTTLPLTGIESPPDQIAMPLDDSAMGSLYSAPELGHCYDFNVDLYSLGMTLFFIWDSPRDVDELITRIEAVKETAQLPTDFQGPQGLREQLLLLLSHDPEKRGTSLQVLRSLQKLEEEVLIAHDLS